MFWVKGSEFRGLLFVLRVSGMTRLVEKTWRVALSVSFLKQQQESESERGREKSRDRAREREREKAREGVRVRERDLAGRERLEGSVERLVVEAAPREDRRARRVRGRRDVECRALVDRGRRCHLQGCRIERHTSQGP